MTISNDNKPSGSAPTVRVSLALWIGLGGLATAFSTALAGVMWLGQMRADIDSNQRFVVIEQATLKAAITELQSRIERMDIGGTRALATVQKDIGTLHSSNTIQDQRIMRNDNRIDELIKQQTEHSFWIKQFQSFMQQYAHPPLPARPPP